MTRHSACRLAAAALVAALGLLGWRPVGEPPQRAAAEWPPRPAVVDGDGEAPAQAATPPIDRPAAARRLAADEVDVCGTVVKLGSDGALADDWAERLPGRPRVLERMASSLRASGSDFERAAAELLDIGLEVTSAWLRGSCKGEDCPSAAARAAADSRREDLARRALASSDPRLYALAFKLCGAGAFEPEATCRQLSVAQWARLDPGNASPWLFALAAAAERGDRVAQEEALFRIGSAPFSRLGQHDLVGAMLAVAPSGDAAKPTLLEMASQAVGMSSWGMPSYSPLLAMCQPADLLDANRAQACAAAAEVLAERSDSMMDRLTGGVLGARVGWPEQRVDRLRGEYLEFIASQSPVATLAPVTECAAIGRVLANLREAAKSGETGVLREWLLASRRPAESFISAGRAERLRRAAAETAINAERVARAAKATNAASAASGGAR